MTVPSARTLTLPRPGRPAILTDDGTRVPSGAESFSRTAMATGCFIIVDEASSFAVGGRLAGWGAGSPGRAGPGAGSGSAASGEPGDGAGPAGDGAASSASAGAGNDDGAGPASGSSSPPPVS